MRVAVYGGSFDPPHVGHAMVAAWLRWTDRVDAVWLLPTYVHAFGKEMRPYDLRLRLCFAMAGAVGDHVAVSDVERDLPAPSYTIDTLNALAARHPEHAFRLVVGSDNLAWRDKWKGWPEIEARYAPIVAGRSGYPIPEDTVAFPEVSSTQIRALLRDGRPVGHLVPASVLKRLAGPDGAPYRS